MAKMKAKKAAAKGENEKMAKKRRQQRHRKCIGESGVAGSEKANEKALSIASAIMWRQRRKMAKIKRGVSGGISGSAASPRSAGVALEMAKMAA